MGLAVLLTLPTLALGFMIDDFSHRLMLDRRVVFPGGQRAIWTVSVPGRRSGDVSRSHDVRDRSWWTTPDFRLAFFRPLTSLLRRGYALREASVLMHVRTLRSLRRSCSSWRRFTGAWTAGWQTRGMMFAVDGAHALVVAGLQTVASGQAFSGSGRCSLTRSRAAGGRRWTIAAVFRPLLSGEAWCAALVYILYACLAGQAPRHNVPVSSFRTRASRSRGSSRTG